MPENHRAVCDIRRPDYGDILLDQARSIGAHALAWAERCYASRDFPEQAFATVKGMIQLADDHGAERLDALCAEALDLNRLASGFLRERLKNGGGEPGRAAPRARRDHPQPRQHPRWRVLRQQRRSDTMTLRQPNIDRLLQLGLSGMAEALEEQRDIADVDQLGFDDRLALMIEREAEHRDHKSYLGHLRQAQLRIRADVQDVDCRAGRGIARTTLTQLAAGDWIRQGHNLILGGPTGSGKTFVACALAHQACRQHQSVLYRRVPELVAALIRARDKGTLERLMGRLGRVSLLVLDDWGLQGFSAEGRRDLLEIVEARHGRKSILIASQIPVDGWPEVIGEPTIADAVLDRIVHNAYRIELKGESQRKRNKPPPLDGGGNRAPA